MSRRSLLVFSALSGFFYVAFGTFASHVLVDRLTTTEMEWIFKASQYLGLHTLVILAIGIGLLVVESRWWRLSGLFMMLGILLFSGSLYAIALTGLLHLAFITPFGGSCFLLGWLCLLMGALRDLPARRSV